MEEVPEVPPTGESGFSWDMFSKFICGAKSADSDEVNIEESRGKDTPAREAAPTATLAVVVDNSLPVVAAETVSPEAVASAVVDAPLPVIAAKTESSAGIVPAVETKSPLKDLASSFSSASSNLSPSEFREATERYNEYIEAEQIAALNKEHFKALVKGALPAEELPSEQDLDRAFKIADSNETGFSNGYVDLGGYIALLGLVKNGSVKDLAKKSSFTGMKSKEKRRSFSIELGRERGLTQELVAEAIKEATVEEPGPFGGTLVGITLAQATLGGITIKPVPLPNKKEVVESSEQTATDVDSTKIMIITKVPPGSRASRIGIQEGDRLHQIGPDTLALGISAADAMLMVQNGKRPLRIVLERGITGNGVESKPDEMTKVPSAAVKQAESEPQEMAKMPSASEEQAESPKSTAELN